MANILIVDDSRTSRKVLRNLLEAEGHTIVDEAVNGQEAVQKVHASKPDLVTLDITMPIVDGVEALKMIRAMDEQVKIVMVTAAGQAGKVVECVREGANDFVTKPFEPNKIIEVISSVLAGEE